MKKRDEQKTATSMKMASASSSDDEDSDVEKNFALLTERGRAEEGEGRHAGEEEEEFSEEEEDDDNNDDGQGSEDEEGSECDDGEEEEEQVEGGRENEASDDDDDDDDSDDDEKEEEEEDPEDAGGSSEIQTRDEIKKELSNMSFEDILKLQNKVGTKVYNEVAYGSNKTTSRAKKKRLNKNRPMEISAKRAAPFLRQVIAVRKPTFRDPRFDDLSGQYKPEIFEKTYRFINDIKHKEKEVVQQKLKKTKKNDTQRKEKLQFLLKRMENQERARQSREQQREKELQFKRQQRERANQGARPFFLKNSEKKKLQLAEKYQELKKSGKLENFLSKKRKRNAVKDRRKLPKQLQGKKAV